MVLREARRRADDGGRDPAGPSEDLYIVLGGYDPGTQQATYAITVNPLVELDLVRLCRDGAWNGARAAARERVRLRGREDTRRRRDHVADDPAAAPARGACARAQHVENPIAVPVVPRTQLEKDLQNEIICMCGTCGRKRIGECTCSLAADMREEVAKMVAEGKTRDQVYAYYIAKYGSQEPLASPIDQGFNRLAWFFPYLVGATGAACIAVVAFRWSRRARSADGAAGPTAERLIDELRDARVRGSSDELREPRLSDPQPPVQGRGTSSSSSRCAASTAAVLMSRRSSPEHLILISLTIGGCRRGRRPGSIACWRRSRLTTCPSSATRRPSVRVRCSSARRRWCCDRSRSSSSTRRWGRCRRRTSTRWRVACARAPSC